jgi:hypothetical protein
MINSFSTLSLKTQSINKNLEFHFIRESAFSKKSSYFAYITKEIQEKEKEPSPSKKGGKRFLTILDFSKEKFISDETNTKQLYQANINDICFSYDEKFIILCQKEKITALTFETREVV